MQEEASSGEQAQLYGKLLCTAPTGTQKMRNMLMKKKEEEEHQKVFTYDKIYISAGH